MKVPLVLIIVLGGASAFLLPCSVRSNGAVRYTYLKSKSEWARDDGVHVRPGKTDDETAIRTTLAKMLMNPLSIDVQNFVCAEDEGKLIGFGQVRPIGEDYELASLHVQESSRGRGIGSALVRQLLADFEVTHGSEKLGRLFLLTLADTAYFYEKLGFEVVSAKEVPAVLNAERAVGSFIQSFFGNALVCMRATPC